jgi:DNA (cytosine-5)-methyltransferase 3A
MRVVSLFDGISCLRVALGDREVEYHASEIDPYAIKVSHANYPEIKRLGDVRKVEMIEDVDLLCGGSPCQDLSVAKNGRKGLEGDKSSLFYEYLRILHLLKPKWFILENVNSMPKKDRDIITKEMGVEPIMIDASLVSAQSRKRLFWTNIPVVGLPTDRKIFLKDILQPDADIDEKMFLKSEMKPREKKQLKDVEGKSMCLSATCYKGSQNNGTTLVKSGIVYVGAVEGNIRKGMEGQEHLSRSQFEGNRVYSDEGKAKTVTANGGGKGGNSGLYKVGHIGNSDGQGSRVYSTDGKSVTLSANGGGGGAKTGLYQVSPYPIHIPTGTSKEVMRVGHEQRRKLDENGTRADDSDVEAIRRIETRNDDKSGTLTTVLKDNHIVNTQESKIRKLTPVECERLQSLPDGYTKNVSNSQRYKCLGNAFNVEVIKFILSFIPETDSQGLKKV